MATDNEMRAAGIHLPGGSDYISEGDDAISANARVLFDRIEGARFDRGSVYGAALDELGTGMYWVATSNAAQSLELPVIAQGSLYVTSPSTDTLGSALFVARLDPPRLYLNTKQSDGWTGWQQLANHEGSRQTAFSLNHPRGMDSEPGSNRQYRIPFKLGARARLKRVAFRNYDYNSDTPGVGQVDLRGAGIGEHRMAEDGSMTGLFIEGSTVHQVSKRQVAPADHSVFYGDDVDIELEPHKEYLLSYAYSADESMTVRRQLGQCFGSRILGAWNNTGTTTATPQTFMGLHVWIELEVDKSTPVWAYVGDSQLAGLSTARPAYDSWAQVHAYNNGAIPQILAHPGGSLQDFLDLNKRALRKWDHLDKADRIYIAGLGSNDISNGRPFTGLQDYFATVAQNVRAKFSPNLYATTTVPRVEASASDAVRDAYNDWLLTLPEGVIAASDHFAAVLDPVTGFTDERWQGPGGDVHLNTAGNARLAQATDGLVTRTTPPEPGPRTTGWRDVTAWVPDRVSGRMLIRRDEDTMVFVLDELVLSVSGSVSVNRFPTGLRPLYRVRGDWFPSIGAIEGGSVNISGGGYCNIYGVVADQAMSARIVADVLPGSTFPSPYPGDPA